MNPFNGLDNFIQQELQTWLLELQQQLKKTILFINHHLAEAVKISHRVLVLTAGKGIIHEAIIDRTNLSDSSISQHKNDILSAMRKR